MIRLHHLLQSPEPQPSYATIALSAYQSVQGPVLRRFHDGRVMIDTGRGRLTGRPLGVERASLPVWSPLFAGMI
ncbi:hypothetical protein [Paracoccus ravus]|uniref:hypothetical protein n=1 Tax=Paracoccus ravus TaxID=2447760 RepID=UPI001FD6B10F|nr:hypothetical protein [Paracoccus ravus]